MESSILCHRHTDCTFVFLIMSSDPFEELRETLGKEEVVDVWCLGCQAFTKMNAKYAKIIGSGEIESCARCRAK